MYLPAVFARVRALLFQRSVIWVLASLHLACTPLWETKGAQRISDQRAMEHVRAQVSFGPRPPGSKALERCRDYIAGELRNYGYAVEEDRFVATTPYGAKAMSNLIARGEDGGKDVIVLASHYDTKYMADMRFVGANDAASSTGLLLELARVLAGSENPLDYWFVFFDGEEAFVQWSTFDSTYGSRHLAKRWKQEGVIARIRAFVLLDMVGDRDLDLLADRNSTPWLRDLVRSTAREIGLAGILSPVESAVEDDHIPFKDAGIPAVDIIDLNFGPNNSYHHTEADTIEKVSEESLGQVGRLVLAVLGKLQTPVAP